AEACAIESRPALSLRSDEHLMDRRTVALPSWRELLAGRCQKTDERPGYPSRQDPPRAVFPGSFHPLHHGHRQMVEFAERKLGAAVDYELSIVNVDKPSLDFEEMTDRAAQLPATARV